MLSLWGNVLVFSAVLGILVSATPPVPRKNTLFASNSAWRAKLPDNAPISSQTPTYVKDFLRQCNYSGSGRAIGDVWIGISFPYYYPNATQPTTTVQVGGGDPLLTNYSKSVPIPPGVQPQTGSDHEIIFHQESTDNYWEYWLFTLPVNSTAPYTATWGGYMANVSASPGFFQNPVSNWGAAASSIQIAGGLMSIADAYAGIFPYAIRLTLQDHASGFFVSPAQRTDGNGNSPIPQGTRFRLPASFNVSSLSNPFARILATAIRDYGMITTDTSYGMPVLYAEDTTQYLGYNGTNTTNLWPAVWGNGYPDLVLRGIPWDQLQVVDPTWQPWNSMSPWYQEGEVTGPSGYKVTAVKAIFNDSLASGWADSSWNTPINWQVTNPTNGGTYAVSATFYNNAGAFALRFSSGVNTTAWNAVQMWVLANASSVPTMEEQCFSIFQLVSDGYPNGHIPGMVRMCTLFNEGMPTTWTQITIPFADMGWKAGMPVQGFWIQSQMRNAGPSILYIDDINLVNIQPVYAPPKPSTSTSGTSGASSPTSTISSSSPSGPTGTTEGPNNSNTSNGGKVKILIV